MSETAEIHASQPGVAAKYLRTAQVVFPEGIVRFFRIHKNAEGQILFDLATDYVLLASGAKGYLALTYLDRKRQPRFLNNDVAIGKQVAAKYWNFVLSFKFYVAEPEQLSDGLCRHYMLHQCRRDVHLGRIPTDFVTEARLAGYVAQMEMGDFQETANYADYYANVLSPERSTDEEFVAAVREVHGSLSGQTPHQTELDFLNCCKKLPLYGCHRVSTKDSRTVPLDVAIGAPGLFIYEVGRGITNSFPWHIIEKVSFRRKFFCIKFLKNLPDQPVLDGQSVVFKLESTSVAERFYKLVIEHHAFFRLAKPSPKRKGKGFFQWASLRFLKMSSEATPSKPPSPDNDETVMTVRLEETNENDDDETATNISSILDRTQLTDEEGSVYNVESKEIDHDYELSRAILEATKLNPHVAVECLGSEM